MSEADQPGWHIAGNGAVGMALAYRLHRIGTPVTLLTHRDHGDRMDLEYEPFGEATIPWTCDALARPDGRTIHDLVVCTKAYSVRDVLSTWGSSLAADARIYFLQNGIGFETGDLSDGRRALFVVNGGFTAYRTNSNHVVQSAMRPIWIGDESGDNARSDLQGRLDTLRDAGFLVQWTTEIMLRRWEKISINAVVNSQAVLHDCDNGHLLTHPEAVADTRSMCDELGMLFEAMSVELTGAHLLDATRNLLKATSRNVCSTLQDYRHGLARHELDYINGALLEQARKRAIPMPRFEAIYTDVVAKFRGNASPATF